MDNFDLKKYLNEGFSFKSPEAEKDYAAHMQDTNPDKEEALNNDEQAVAALNAVTRKYGIRATIAWLEGGL